MDVSKNTKIISAGLLACLFLSTVNASPRENANTFVEVGAKYEYSNQVSEPADTRSTDNTVGADLILGYKKSFAKSNISLNYNAEYEDEDDSQENFYWVGTSALSQQLFTKNLLFKLQHARTRYIIDQTQSDNDDDNLDEKDVLNAGLQWTIPYSSRANFIASADHSETWYSQASSNNYNTNQGKFSWQYALTKKTTLQTSYSGSETNYDDIDSTYREHQLDARLTRRYQLGSYSVNAGKTWINGLSSDYDGEHYGLAIDAKFNKHLLTLSASKTLTSSSTGSTTGTSTDTNQNQLFWYTYLSLTDQYTIINNKLISNINFYYAHDDQVATLYETDSDIYNEDKYGGVGELIWTLTEKLSSSISVNYYKAALSNDDTKTFTETALAAKYNVNKSIYIEISAAFEKLNYARSSSGYEEQSYATRIAFRY